jgi:glycosyltransferase involved in cell wall biosynthesis
MLFVRDLQLKMLPKISLVTTNFNYGQYIEETIHSVVQQDYSNLEYLIADGGSTDQSLGIIKQYQQHIFHWESKPDKGPYSAINEALGRASGEIFGWLNSDDILLPGALKLVGEIFAAHPSINWLTTLNRGVIDASGFLSVDPLPGLSRASFLDGRNLPCKGRGCHGVIQQESTFFRSQLWERVGGLDLNFPLGADFALWAAFAKEEEIYATPKMIGAFRNHGSNRSASLSQYLSEARASLSQTQRDIDWNIKKLRDLVSRNATVGRTFLARTLGYTTHIVDNQNEHKSFVARRAKFL